MAAEDLLGSAGATDSNPFKAPGNVLGALLARFTADRDALVAAVRKGEVQLGAITARLDASSTATAHELNELRQLIEQLQYALRQAGAEACARSDHALSRAEAAVRSVEELAAVQRGRADEAAAQWSRASTNQEALKTGLDACQSQLATLAARLDDLPSGDPLAELRCLIERSATAQDQTLTQVRATSERAMACAEDALRSIEELRAGQRASEDHQNTLDALRTATERLTTVFEGVDARLHELRAAAAASGETASGVAARVDAVETKLAALELASESRAAQADPAERNQASAARRWLRPALATLAPVLAFLLAAAIWWPGLLRRPTVGHSPQLSPHVVAPPRQAPSEPMIEAGALRDAETGRITAPVAPIQPETRLRSRLVALEPRGTTACVVEPEVDRVCVYRRAAAGIAADRCYTFVGPPVGQWPPWLVGGEPTAQRLQLMDETAKVRLQVVAEGTWTDGQAAQLRPADFDALVGKLVPWRTIWVVREARTAPAPAADVSAVRETLERWRDAWEARRFEEYASYYGAAFVPQSAQDRAHWQRYKQRLFERSEPISVHITPPSIVMVDNATTALVTFEQSYRSKTFKSRAHKAMRWQRDGDRWTIRIEAVLHEVVEPTRRAQTAHR